MVRAHFIIRLGNASLPASAAQWVEDAEAARSTARTIVQGLMRQHGGDPRLMEAAMVITDDDGAVLLEMSFFDTLYLPVEPVPDADRRRPRAPRSWKAPRRSPRTSWRVTPSRPPTIRTSPKSNRRWPTCARRVPRS
ncbi:catalase [Methylobacterium organophilum]|nr:catalase [Methylobacterium organophilum]